MGKRAIKGVQIKMLRERLGLTQVEFAQETDFTPSTISCWERGISEPSKVAIRVIREVMRRHYLNMEGILRDGGNGEGSES